MSQKTPQKPQQNTLSLEIPDLKPKNKRGEHPKSQGIYFLFSDDWLKTPPTTDEDINEKVGYEIIPRIKEAVGSNNLKAVVVKTLLSYEKHLIAKGLIKVEETPQTPPKEQPKQ